MKNSEITLKDIYQAIEDFRKEVREQYVTIDRFNPIEKIGIIL